MNTKASLTTAMLVAGCVWALSACTAIEEAIDALKDEGLGFRPPDISSSRAIAVTGGNQPDFSSDEAKSSQLAIIDEFNVGHVTDVWDVNWDAEVYQRSGYCSSSGSCERVPALYGSAEFQPIMTANGVRIARLYNRASIGDGGVATTLGYGGWMTHSLFAVQIQTDTFDGGTFVNGVTGFGVALGDAPETNPAVGPFVWNGVMVGRNTDISSSDRGNIVQGDVAITARSSAADGMRLDVEFTDIKDLNDRSTLSDMQWSGLRVSEGTFESYTIEGSFFGPGHEEVAGTFEKASILGAYGARR